MKHPIVFVAPAAFRWRTLALAAVLASGVGSATAQTAAEAELLRRVDALAGELATLKAQLQQLQQQPRPAAPSAAVAATAAPASVAAATSPETAPARANEPATVITSYGEIGYSRPVHASQDTQADVGRFVLGYQHRFDERTKVVTELEVEHTVSSADDAGEVEVEQAYIEHQFNPAWGVRAGLFLMPAGLLNENHEPTAYLGVNRNFVETAIIPTTWREGGVQLVGQFDNGLTLQTGLSTGFDLGKWDASAESEGLESPLGSVHQELSLAKARSLALFGALNWRGVPGLLLGGSLFTGDATQGKGPSARVTLWDLHARWTPGAWDLSALVSGGHISNTAALNATLVGNPILIPEGFDGWYAQAGYAAWQKGDYKLTPFARFEQTNTARSYADLGPGLTPTAAKTESVWTLGANFQLNPAVVFKADYQRFRVNRNADRLNLGLGWSF